MIICISFSIYPISYSNDIVTIQKQYLDKANYQFDKQNLNACLDNLYIYNHYCKIIRDTSKVAQIWFEIACLNLLKSQYTKALADLYLSTKYSNASEILFQKALFEALFSYKKKKYTNTLKIFRNLSPYKFKINHLATLMNIYISNAINETQKTSYVNNCSEYELIKLQKAKDTLWFGYPVAIYYSGIYFLKKNQYLRSKTKLNEAILKFEQLGAINTEWLLSYFNILNVFNLLDDKTSSKIFFSRVEELKHKCCANIENEYILDEIKANHYYFDSNYKDEYLVLLKIIQRKSDDSAIKIKTLQALLLNQVMQKNYQAAIKYYELIPITSQRPFDDALAGRCYFAAKNNSKANTLMKKCEKNLDSSDLYYSSILYDLSWHYLNIGDINNEKRMLLLNLKFIQKTFNPLNFHFYEIYDQLGYFYWKQSNFENSLLYYHKAAYSLLNIEYNSDIYCLPDISKSMDDYRLEKALLYKAETLYQISKTDKVREINLKRSLTFFELSIKVLDRYKSTIPLDEQKLVSADLYKKRYPNIIKVCLELYNCTHEKLFTEKAFEYVEKSKSSLLLSLVKGVTIQKMNILPEILIKNEERIRNKEANLSANLANALQQKTPNYSIIDKIINNKYKLELTQDSLKQLIKTKYPVYYTAKYNEQVTTAHSLQSKLYDNEAIIQYSLNYDFLVTYVLTKYTYKIFTDTLKNNFFDDVSDYQKLNSHFNFKNINFCSVLSYCQLSNKLYNRLIKPAEPYIKNKKITIIPDDVLNQIPFETLVAELPSKQNTSFDKLHYLIRDHAVSYNFSGTLYGLNYQHTIVNNTKTLAIAPKYGKLGSTKLQTSAKDQFNNKLSSIKGTSNEVNEIKQSFHQAKIIEFNATEKKFKDIASQYDIIHLAMHGVIDNENPMFSKLIFEPGNDSINEGFLNTYELYNLQLNASLVVLSACNSGSGKLHSGEGIISLARGFFSAGAKSIIMTLWPVADKSSSRLMSLFYSNLAISKNIGDAMQSAKLDYLNNVDNMSSHPYFWSGYIATGNTNIIFKAQRSISWIYYSFLTILMVSGITLVLRKKLFTCMINFSRQRSHKTSKFNIK